MQLVLQDHLDLVAPQAPPDWQVHREPKDLLVQEALLDPVVLLAKKE